MPREGFTSVGALSRSGVIATIDLYPTDPDIESHLRSHQAVLSELITYIESIEYDCECGSSSSTAMLRRVFEDNKKAQELVELCKDRTVAVFILGHMLEITTRPIDVDYRNPWEIAVTTYLYAITQARTDLTHAAITVAYRLKNGFWTIKYIESFL